MRYNNSNIGGFRTFFLVLVYNVSPKSDFFSEYFHNSNEMAHKCRSSYNR